MGLCERIVLFPLLDRLCRNDIRLLSSTCKALRRACIGICPGYWSRRLLIDTNLDLDPDEVGHASEHVHFLHYISKWSPWRVGMSKYDRMGLTLLFDTMIFSSNGLCVRSFGGSAFSMAPSLTPPVQCDGNRYKHMTVNYDAAYLCQDGALHIKDAGISAAVLLSIPPCVRGVKYVNIGHDRRIIIVNHDGTLVTWGQCAGKKKPPLPTPGTKFIMACSAEGCDMALRSDGIIIVWNCTELALAYVPTLPDGVRYIQICMGNNERACALRSDGQIVMWGRIREGENAIPTLPPNTWYVKVKACDQFCMALRSDGRLVTWGTCALFESAQVPGPAPGSCYVDMAIESAGSRCVALCSDGYIHVWAYVCPMDTNLWTTRYTVYDHF